MDFKVADLIQLFRGEHRDVLLLYIIGNPIGCILGYLSKVLPELLIQMGLSYSRIPSPLILGVAIGLLIEFVSFLTIFFLTNLNRQLYVPVTWLLLGISSGTLASLTVFSGVVVSTGFILPYLVVLLLPCLLVCIVGRDTISFLVIDALKLIASYVVITLIDVFTTLI